MCEFCKETEVTVERLDPEDSFPCEWISEESGPGACAERAAYAVSDWFVDDHLCEAHKLETEKQMDEGLGDFLEGAGFSPEFEIKPIEQEETCDYFAPDSVDWKPCGKKARFAKYILDTSLVCAEHAKQMKQESNER